MNYYTEELTQVTPALEEFIEECKLLGWKNNSSLKELICDWCLEKGMWYATYTEDKIISLTGIHPFKDGYRALYRGAQLKAHPVKGLNRYQMQSWGIYDHLPLQIEFANGKPLYITTNVTNDASGRMNRIHKSFSVMAAGGMVDYIGDEQIFNAVQSVWRLNNDKYFEIRKRHES